MPNCAPAPVLPQEPAVAPNTLLTSDGGLETWYLGGRDMVLYSGDTSHHKDNLLSGRPSVWVVIRGNDPSSAEVVDVTADPYEGEGYASDLDLTVEAVPMPVSMRKLVKDFVETHHVEIPFKKRKTHAGRPKCDERARAARTERGRQMGQAAPQGVNANGTGTERRRERVL